MRLANLLISKILNQKVNNILDLIQTYKGTFIELSSLLNRIKEVLGSSEELLIIQSKYIILLLFLFSNLEPLDSFFKLNYSIQYIELAKLPYIIIYQYYLANLIHLSSIILTRSLKLLDKVVYLSKSTQIMLLLCCSILLL